MLTTTYLVEKEQNIALARNKAVAATEGDFIAFIDDDEIPIDQWLKLLLDTLMTYATDGVLGPVKSVFEVPPAEWLVKAGVFERPCNRTGVSIDWKKTGTGNVLLRQHAAKAMDGPFSEKLGTGGEDIDFFRRAVEAGKTFVWCEEAIAYEVVPRERTQLSFQLKRALMRGRASLRGPAGNAPGIAKSLAACAIYTVLLPIFLMAGRHVFIKYLISDFDHLGKVLARCGISPIGDKYISE